MKGAELKSLSVIFFLFVLSLPSASLFLISLSQLKAGKWLREHRDIEIRITGVLLRVLAWIAGWTALFLATFFFFKIDSNGIRIPIFELLKTPTEPGNIGRITYYAMMFIISFTPYYYLKNKSFNKPLTKSEQ